MKAIRVHETGDVSKLTYEEAPLPEPKADEVRIKVEAAGKAEADGMPILSFNDWTMTTVMKAPTIKPS